MILPNIFLPARSNLVEDCTGIDSLAMCQDIKHFKSYPHPVNYHYNSRGFRDAEWPDTLEDSIWCLGDSFTVGLGQPYDHIWPQVLQHRINTRTINVSLNGASNSWIARKAQEILQEIKSCTIIIHWSFLQRCELDEESTRELQWERFYNDVKDSTWPIVTSKQINTLPHEIQVELETIHNNNNWRIIDDENRLLQVDFSVPPEQNITNTINAIKAIESSKNNNKVVHSFITDFSFMTKEVTPSFNEQLDSLLIKYIPEFPKLDLARDGYHYGELTSSKFVDQIISML